MSNDTNLIEILQKLSEIGERVVRLDERYESVQRELNDIHQEDKRTNLLLEEHIRNTKTNTERLTLEIEARKEAAEANAEYQQIVITRLSKLEKYPQFFKSTKEIAVWIAKVSAPISIVAGALTKILGMW